MISNRAKLDLQMGYMVVRGEETVKIHLGEIGTLMVENTAVSLTVSLLAELTKRKVKVIFCDEKRNPSSELISLYGRIVTEKIRKQEKLLEILEKGEEADLLTSYLQEMQWNDATNREGHAAKVYFNALFGMDFTRTADTSTNAALNYGYSIILSAFNREVTSGGYMTQLGLFHDNMFNAFNFSSDLMEPFRILVDQMVVKMNLSKFEHEEKMQLVNLLNQEVEIDGKVQYVVNAIKVYCKSVFDALNEDDSSLIRFYKLEL